MTRTKRGFTLIELLLVLVIIGVLTAVSVPSFVRSMQGNRLRSAARTVAAAGRYARSMAVLHQRPVAVTFALEGHAIRVDLAGARQPANQEEAPLFPESEGLVAGRVLEAGSDAAEGAAAGEEATDPAIRIERHLVDVRIAEVEIEGWERRQADRLDTDPVTRIVYGTNGRCRPHRIVLVDGEGAQIVVVVDLLGGTEIRER